MGTFAQQVDFLLADNRNSSGSINSGGTVEFFEDSGRTTYKDVYDTRDKNAVLSQPITLDIRGTTTVFADGIYYVTVKDSAGNTVDTIDQAAYVYDTTDTNSWVNVASTYGTTGVALQSAITAAGSDDTTFIITEAITIEQDITVPSNVLLWFLYGAYFTTASTYTTTIEGDIEAPYFNIFQGAGTTTISNKKDVKDIWSTGSGDLGDLKFDDVDILGTLDLTGNLAINTNKFTVAAATGNTNTAGTLDVTGAVGIDGDFDINTNKLTVAAATGNTNIAGTLDVTGAVGIDGDFDINTNKFTVAAATGNINTAGTLDVTGAVGIDGDFDINTNKFTVAAATGNTNTAGTLDVTGAATVGSLTDGTATLDGSGALTGLTNLTVDNLNLNGNNITSTSGDLNITPIAGSAVVVDSHFKFDGVTLTALTNNNTEISAYTGKNITVESVTFDGGVVGGVSNLTMSGTLDVGINTIYDENMTGDWGFNSGNLSGIGTATANSITDGTITISGGNLTGATGVTATTLTGTLDTEAQTNVTSLGILTALQVDNININGNDITSTSGAMNITPLSGQNLNVTLGTTGDFVVNTDDLVVDTSEGRVGVQTATPLSTLDARGSVRGNYDTNTTSYFGRAAIGYAGDSDQATFAHIDFNTTTGFSVKQNNAGDSVLNCESGRNIFFTNGGSTTGIINSSGNFGLGLASPQNRAHLSVSDSGANYIQLTNSTTGETAADGMLLGLDASENVVLGTYESAEIRFYTSGFSAADMVIDSGGDVGVGIAIPSVKMDINGAVKAGYDTDTLCHMGRAAIGNNGTSDSASFAHLDHNSTTSYALQQNDAGDTLLNAASGRSISFAINAAVKMKLNTSGGFECTSLSYDSGTTNYITETVELGNWNMDSTASITVSTNATASTLRSIQVIIREDDGDLWDLQHDTNGSGAGGDWGLSSGGTLTLNRHASGFFDNTNFDDSPYNRGWATITYEA